MSATIAVRIGGQAIGVPPMALDWAEKHPRLVELCDWFFKAQVLGQVIDGEPVPLSEELAMLRAFVTEACKAAGASEEATRGACTGDIVEIRRLYAALRGVEPADPTASPSG